MNKPFLLLTCICCILFSCNRIGSHSLDGTKWKSESESNLFSGYDIVSFDEGYAQFNNYPAVSYSLKGNTITFSNNLATYSFRFAGRYDVTLDKVATLNKEKTVLKVGSVYQCPNGTIEVGEEVFNRVIE